MDEEKYSRLAERLKEPVPAGRSERAREFVTDFAIGCEQGAWGDQVLVMFAGDGIRWTIFGEDMDFEFSNLLKKKWSDLSRADFNYMCELDYLRQEQLNGQARFKLTYKGIGLGVSSTISPKVFISYKHGPDPSPTLALLIVEHIKNKTNAIPYHDESLRKKISQELREEIERSVALVCILGKDSLIRGSGVRDELEIARTNNKQIEFVWLTSFKRGPIDDQPDELKEWVDDEKAVRVLEENTKGYNTAIGELIDRLCVSKYISMKL